MRRRRFKSLDPAVAGARWYLEKAREGSIAAYEVDWLINLRETNPRAWRDVEATVSYRHMDSLRFWTAIFQATRDGEQLAAEDELIDRRWCGHCPTQRSGLDYLQPTQRRPEI